MAYTASHWGSYTFDDATALRPLSDDPSPSRIGRGWLSAVQDKGSRIQTPAVRKGWLAGDSGENRCDDSYVAVSWERATSLVAQELTRVASKHGNGAIFAGSYGWASAGRFHHAQGHLRRFLNLTGGFVSHRDTYSHAAAEVLWPYVLGLSNRAFQDQMTSLRLVEENCQVLLAFGGISERTGQVASSGTRRHDVGPFLRAMQARGARMICVSPRGSDTPGAETWAIRPGTDTALMLALAYEIVAAGEEDSAFLERCTSGWPHWRAYLMGESDGQPKTAAWASEICDLPAQDITALARDLVRKPSMIATTWGMQRADHGEQPIWAALALACVIGQVGKPGTGFSFGYGCTTVVGRPSRLIDWPSMPQGRNLVTDFIPVARIADMLLHPGETYPYRGETRTYPDIRLVYWAGGNPYHHHQDLHRLETAWTRPETVIIQDHSWTATTRRADIVLPATTPLERSDLMMNRRDPGLLYMAQVMPPMGEALDDFEIFRRIAAHMGLEQAFTEGRDADGWLRNLWDRAGDVAHEAGFALPDYDAFTKAGRFDLPAAEEHRIALDAFVRDPEGAPLANEHGKISLFHQGIAAMGLADCPGYPAWLPPCESLLDAVPDALHLISGQPDTRLHSQNDCGSEAQADKIQGREPAYLHPDAATARGLVAGDILRLWNARGACLAGLRLDPTMRTDCIALATGAWYDPQMVDGARLEVHGNPNCLTIDKGASGLSQANIAHTALVQVEKWTGQVPDLTVTRPPKITPDPDA